MAGPETIKTVKTTCPYCGVGCGVLAQVKEDGSVAISGDPEHPSNFGRLCSKGSALGETLSLDDRLFFPEIEGAQASWDEALDLVADRFTQAVREYGPDSVAFYVSGQILTEDYYVANKLMKGFIGSANIDTNSRLCMASSVAGHRRSFGSDTVPGTYEDLESCELLVLVGSNLAWCHPVLFQRVEAAKAANPQMRVVVIDPRETATCAIADLHLALKPDSDVALFNGLLAFLSEAGALDQAYIKAHTNGFEDAVASAGACEINRIAEATGLARRDLATFYTMVARTEKTVTVYSQGVNQSTTGTDKVNAIINTHLATGRIGRAGMGPFSVTGQPNAMGGREVGGLANMLASHMAIENPKHRAIVQDFWQSPVIAEKPGLKAVDLFRAARSGKIKALWIMATNPVDSLPDADGVADALKACPFVVVSDVTRAADTVGYANVLLPAAAWGEKDGTVTNSERRISRQRSLLDLPGETRPDWWQLSEVACRMGFKEAFDYSGPDAIFREHAALSGYENRGSRDFDISALAGLALSEFDGLEPVQWPQPSGMGSGEETRFFANGNFYTPDRKAAFVATKVKEPRETGRRFPFVLNTGRIRDQWHTMTRTGKTPRLAAHIAEPYVEIHPVDAKQSGIDAADLVEVKSPYGAVTVRAQVTEKVQKGTVFVPMHWTDQVASQARVDAVVAPETDPFSGQPGSKFTPVAIRKKQYSWYGFAVMRSRPQALDVDYWAIAPTNGGWRIEMAGIEQTDLTAFSERLMGNATEPLRLEDRNAGYLRVAGWCGDDLDGAFFFSKDPVAVSRQWACSLLESPTLSRDQRFKVLAGRPPADMPDKGAIVCSCFQVGNNQIAAAVKDGAASLSAIGACLEAGTNCGSCRSEIQAIIDGFSREISEDVDIAQAG
ncbi:nitrate reductase (plasmid) [Roseibium porphyridii]|uniref:Nitrate reductase n=1 Tax=Roseibium porphyridii TaxID=2866279 RepID=A0ABY8FAS3_9HYPH|nr:nitrate reductase [Roseibium sp. KMA01]WFE92603.1 nitrate reductase [Roseibium sp. KMA01]